MASTYRHVRMIGVASLAIATAVAQAQPPDNRQGPRGGPPATRGADMITSEERAAFCTRMRESRTPEEREAIMRGMHELMQSRARERGVPPPQGQGYGPRGLDQGMGCGPMMEGGPRGPARSGAPPAAAAGAGSGAAAIPPTASGVASPRERQVDGLVYLSGGIGTDEAAAMRSAADRYSLRLTFSGRGGEYLADVESRIYRPDGKQIFAAISDGPFLFVRLPPGSYRVVATWEGTERTAQVTVPARGGVARNLTWPS